MPMPANKNSGRGALNLRRVRGMGTVEVVPHPSRVPHILLTLLVVSRGPSSLST